MEEEPPIFLLPDKRRKSKPKTFLNRASKDAIIEVKKARYVKSGDDKTVTYEDVNIDDVSTVG